MEIDMFILGIILKMYSRYFKVGGTDNNHFVTERLNKDIGPLSLPDAETRKM